MNAAARDAIVDTVRAIPFGRVASYGQVATAAGLPGRARLVGRALGTLHVDDSVPWHRVINAAGRISFPVGSDAHDLQRGLLEDEGVEFVHGRVRDRRFWWDPAD